MVDEIKPRERNIDVKFQNSGDKNVKLFQGEQNKLYRKAQHRRASACSSAVADQQVAGGLAVFTMPKDNSLQV